MLLLLLAAAAALIFFIIPGGSSPMSGKKNFSFTDLLTLAQNAGFPGTVAVIAAAVALAESGGNPTAYNPEHGSGTPEGKGSYGLWQIYLQAHPEFEGQNLYDPETNARAAYSVYTDAGSFKPWATFKSMAYQGHIPEGYSV